MPELLLSQTMKTLIRSQIPDPDKVDVSRVYEFTLTFKLYPQTEESKGKLERIEADRGPSGFLDEVLLEVEGPKDMTYGVLDDGSQVDALYFVKHHLVCQGDAVSRFWEKINAGIIEKNSKKSRVR